MGILQSQSGSVIPGEGGACLEVGEAHQHLTPLTAVDNVAVKELDATRLSPSLLTPPYAVFSVLLAMRREERKESHLP